MAKFVYFVLIIVIIASIFSYSTAIPTPDEERYLDKEYNRELINWLSSVQYPQQYANPCQSRYFAAGNSLTAPMPKRNSELINSLLSLPKSMNEAGK